MCNDGSAAGYYYAPATSGSESNVWLVMLEGGEWCWDAASCATRAASLGALMGNKDWHQSVAMGGIFETDAVKTPFAGAHKVFVPYCSSDAWVGDTVAGGLYFRGQAIVEAVLADLVQQQNLGQNSADRLLFGGCSAGARGAMFTLDSVADMLARSGVTGVQLQGLLDSPLWIDVAPLATAPLHSGLSLLLGSAVALAANILTIMLGMGLVTMFLTSAVFTFRDCFSPPDGERSLHVDDVTYDYK